jgi:hypothetical protein
MSIRKRDDSVKPGVGYDGAKGENFGKDVGGKFSKASTEHPDPRGKRDIFADVEANSGCGKPGPITHGVNRSQTDGCKE